jgi:hypothetical protein
MTDPSQHSGYRSDPHTPFSSSGGGVPPPPHHQQRPIPTRTPPPSLQSRLPSRWTTPQARSMLRGLNWAVLPLACAAIMYSRCMLPLTSPLFILRPQI